jgi:hypothetical protein
MSPRSPINDDRNFNAKAAKTPRGLGFNLRHLRNLRLDLISRR